MPEEVAFTEVSHLSEIVETKKKINELVATITHMEEEAGITPIKQELHDLEDLYKRQISSAVAQGITQEEHLQLVNKGRVMTVITPKLLFERFPDIFWRTVKVGKGKTEDLLQWFFEDQGQGKPAAKKSVEAIIEEISTKTQSGENYELVDLLEGT